MNLKKIADKKPKTNVLGALTGTLFQGAPSQQNLDEFKQLVEGNAAKMLSEGRIKVRGNECLGVRVQLPTSLTIKSSKDPLLLIGALRKDNDLIGYYRPETGWKKSERAEDLN